jgi:hypothetical protein
MLFRDLYQIAEAVERPYVRFEALRAAVNGLHDGIGRVDVISVEYPEPNHQAFYRLAENDRTTPYEEEFTVAEIVYCDGLNHHPRDRRYALTKELMHVFDTEEQRADTRVKFISLMKEIQNKPMPRHESQMFKSELDTRWMAALVLCPKIFRDQYVAPFRAQEIAAFDIAEIFRIPEWVIPFIMDDYYDVAHATLTAD